MTNIQYVEQTGGRGSGRGRGRGPGSGSGRGNNSGRGRGFHNWSNPPPSRPIFYPTPVIQTVPLYDTINQVVTVQKEVATKAFEIKLQSGDYCGRSGFEQSTRNICDSGMICDNDNKCVTYREDLNVAEMKNREFRLCRSTADTNCVARIML